MFQHYSVVKYSSKLRTYEEKQYQCRNMILHGYADHCGKYQNLYFKLLFLFQVVICHCGELQSQQPSQLPF